ncbi:MAG: DUF4856 domain-containing protein [Gemmatimonadota bacterium]
MKTMTTLRTLLLPLLLLTTAACDGTTPTDPGGDPGPDEIPVPSAYVFDSRFESGTSSVSYPGQTVRNLLVQDLKIAISRLGTAGAEPITVQDLKNLYEYDDALDLSTLSDGGAAPAKEVRYSAISTGKSLKGGPIAEDVVIGYGKTTDELMNEWFGVIAANAQDPEKLGTPAVYTTDEGVDLSQMIEKVLHGAVAYQRGTGNYLANLLEQPNAAAEPNQPFTKMEHYWDEAFGYFGAARDFGRYTDAQLAGSSQEFTFDSDGDGRIDFESEYNFAFAKGAGKRDSGGTGVDFTRDIFEAFLAGRTLIVNQGTTQAIAAEATKVSQTWEKIIAATVVHYINDVLDDMATLTAEQVAAKNHTALNTHWGELKGYAIGLQFNPAKLISTSQLEQFHSLVGNAPVYALPGSAAYDAAVEDLAAAKPILQEAYDFSDSNMANW